MFRFYTNAISNATRGAAAGILSLGLMLIGFGVMIIVFKEIFAWLAAIIFFIAGLGCLSGALKMYIAYRKFKNFASPEQQDDMRRNVRIHELNDFEDQS